MASITRRLLVSSSRCTPRIPSRQIVPRYLIQWQRPLSSTVSRYEDAKRPSSPESKGAPKGPTDAETSSSKEEQLQTETAAQLSQLSKDLESLSPDHIAEAIRQGKRGIPWYEGVDLEKDEDFMVTEPRTKHVKPGFWSEGEPEMGEDEDFYGDDITSLAHGELEQHREIREYARLIAWELPLLHHLAKPFELPTAKTPFRFRYTSYLGEKHPAANKVVVEFSASDMPNLTSVQKDKLIKLAGPRYNPDTDIIKMSCEQFDTLPQNKRFLGDTISALLKEARDGKDTFADVPFDFRHHKPKPRYEFPKEWIITPERKQYLDNKRQQLLRDEDEKAQTGRLVDGQKMIEDALPYITVPEPVVVPSKRGGRLLR